MYKFVALLFCSNIFMTFAWYGHLKNMNHRPLWMAIVVSWLIAFLEYCFQVPANRMGHGMLTFGQLKVVQEVITMCVFAGFALLYMKVPLSKNFLFAFLCLIGAVYFIFKDMPAA